MKKSRHLAVLVLTLGLCLQSGSAGAFFTSEGNSADLIASLPLKTFVSKHRISIGRTQLDFTATAGESYIYDDRGDPIATMFSYTFTKDKGDASRPVLFIVPGGPGNATEAGVSSFGPWRIVRPSETASGFPRSVPPVSIEDNPNSLLDVADLVFIDPVGTGYSRIVGKGKPEQFYGVDVDIDIFAQFVEQWLVRNNRWNSPRYLAGGSYGGLRAAIFPRAFNGDVTSGIVRGITLNGVIPIVNSLSLPGWGAEGLDPALTAATTFPSYAVAAWYHNKIDRSGRSLEAYHEEAYAFAVGDYADALKKEASQTLAQTERAEIVVKLAMFTGLPQETFEKKLSIDVMEFSNLLLSEKRLRLAAYDSRITVPAKLAGPDPVGDDPSLAREFPIEIAGFRIVEREKLRISMERPYIAQDFRNVGMKWERKRRPMALGGDNFKTQAEELGSAMAVNDDLRALIAVNYFDMVMPTAQARLAVELAKLPEDRTSVNFYLDGHSSTGGAAATKLAQDMRAFIRGKVADEAVAPLGGARR